MAICTHTDLLEREVTPNTEGCEECEKTGGWWVRLRLCLTCGHVGCCDDSPGKHATAHHRETGHPVVRSLDETERHMYWCYVDEAAF